MLAKYILRGKSSPRVSDRLERNSLPNKDLICGASLLTALASLCALTTIAYGQSYQGRLCGSPQDPFFGTAAGRRSEFGHSHAGAIASPEPAVDVVRYGIRSDE